MFLFVQVYTSVRRNLKLMSKKKEDDPTKTQPLTFDDDACLSSVDDELAVKRRNKFVHDDDDALCDPCVADILPPTTYPS